LLKHTFSSYDTSTAIRLAQKVAGTKSVRDGLNASTKNSVSILFAVNYVIFNLS